MRTTAKTFAAAALMLALAACGSPSEDQPVDETTPTETVATDAKPAAFAQCAACHSTEAGKHGVGPSLAGVYGTKSGDIPGYVFSDAMKNANLTWDEATLDRYLTAPMTTVAGTKMSYGGMADAAQRKAVIEYLKTLK
jgi:cytochrome c